MTDEKANSKDAEINASDEAIQTKKDPAIKQTQTEGEIGGPAGLEPTRYGDWERKGIVSDF